MEKYRLAAEEGDPDAQATLGALFDSPSEKLKWYRKAAEQGHPGAQSALALMVNGRGIEQGTSSAPAAAEDKASVRRFDYRRVAALLRAGLSTSSATPEAIERFYRQYDAENPPQRPMGAVRVTHDVQVKALIEQFKDDPEAFLAAVKQLKNGG